MQNKRQIIITAVGSAGDMLPHIGLARALLQRGHPVSILSSPAFRELVETAGASFVACCSEERQEKTLHDPRLWNPKQGFAGLWPMMNDIMQASYHYIESQRAQRPILIGSILAFGPRLAAEKFGLPFVATQLAPQAFWSAIEPPLFKGTAFMRWLSPKMRRKILDAVEDKFIDAVCQPDLNSFREHIGLAPVGKVLSAWAMQSDLVLCMFPEWFGRPQPDWPGKLKVVGFPMFDQQGEHAIDHEFRQFMEGSVPVVVFCPGTGMAQAGDYFKSAAEACVRLGIKGVFMTKFPAQLPALPSNVLHREYLPFSDVLPLVSALAHHGGIGSSAQAFRAGVPQLVMPMAHDQFDNAARVARLGCGVVSKWGAGPGAFAKSLQRLLRDSSIQENAKRLSTRFSGTRPPLDEACTAIEALAYNNSR